MRWCRLYIETPSDPKLRRIAHTANATMAATLAVWTSMLCHAASNEGDAWGTLAGWDDLDCAVNLGIDRAIVFAIRREMEGRTLDGNTIMAWSRRQYASDNGAVRMRKWREKKTQETQAPSDPVTSQSRHGDATVTAKNRTEQNREEITNSSHHREGGMGGDAPRPARRPRTDAGHRLPEDWWPSGADQEYARGLGLDIERVADEFRAYWLALPGTKARKLNWSQTFRGRCLQIAGRPPQRAQPAGKLDWVDNHPLFRRSA